MSFSCPNCKTEFSRKFNLERHQEKSCKGKTISSTDIEHVTDISRSEGSTCDTFSDIHSSTTSLVEQPLDTYNSCPPISVAENSMSHDLNTTLTTIIKHQESILNKQEYILNKLSEHDQILKQNNKSQAIEPIPLAIHQPAINPVAINPPNNDVIYVTEDLDYLEILCTKCGSRAKAINFMISKMRNKIKGEVDIFDKIHLSGKSTQWPIQCHSKRDKRFVIHDGHHFVEDDQGVQIHKIFCKNLQQAIVGLNTLHIGKTIKAFGTDDYEDELQTCFVNYDLQFFTTRAMKVTEEDPDKFIIALINKISARMKAERRNQ